MKYLSCLAVALSLLAVGPALARDATCYSTDEGEYDCDFVATDNSGSFEISAPGYTSYSLVIDSPGIAWVFGTFEPGGRAVALPGPYLRSEEDPGCWVNPDTETELCAW